MSCIDRSQERDVILVFTGSAYTKCSCPPCDIGSKYSSNNSVKFCPAMVEPRNDILGSVVESEQVVCLLGRCINLDGSELRADGLEYLAISSEN